MERGGPTLTFAASPRQQQAGSRRSAPSPPITRGDGQPCAPPVPPPAHARGERCGLTVQQHQQQRKSVLTPTEHARLAFSLYRQCVAAGQWARVSVEQRPDGEYITFSSRPSAAAPAAAGSEKVMKPRRRRRRPNQRRVKQKEIWVQSQSKRQQSSLPVKATTAAGATYAKVAASPASPAARVAAATADPTGSPRPTGAASHPPQQLQPTTYRTWEARPAASATAIRLVSTVLSSPAQPRVSSGSDVFAQLDGAGTSPQASPDRQPGGVPESPPSPSSEPSPLSLPTVPPPPPPPPGRVLCRLCGELEHREDFFMCARCHWGSHLEPYFNCPDCEELRTESIHQTSHSEPLFDCSECQKIPCKFIL